MNWRIKIETSQGQEIYIPQYKRFVFWHTCWDHQYCPDNFPIYFESLEKAKEF